MEQYNYILMPLISALIGYITNVVAIKMTFYPLEYKGIRPFWGWQGIIPAKAGRMAEIATDLLTRSLFRPREVFARLDIAEVLSLVKTDFCAMARQIVSQVLDSRVPLSSTILGRNVRPMIAQAVENALPEVVANTMRRIQENIDQVLDLKSLAVGIMKEDKALINKIFLDLGGKQFRFIETSGLWLGFLFGLGQILTFMYVNHWIAYVLYGIFIGYITNFVAIKLIFHPVNPVRIGPFTLWGLFLRNQRAESFKYAEIIAGRIITPENLFSNIFRQKGEGPTYEIMRNEISCVVDRVVEQMPAYIKLVLTNQKIQELKSVTLFNLMHELPLHIGVIYPYADKTLDIKNSIGEKMASLPPAEFIDFLRPAFQEDEWKLIAVGSILGGVAGLLQSLIG